MKQSSKKAIAKKKTKKSLFNQKETLKTIYHKYKS